MCARGQEKEKKSVLYSFYDNYCFYDKVAAVVVVYAWLPTINETQEKIAEKKWNAFEMLCQRVLIPVAIWLDW